MNLGLVSLNSDSSQKAYLGSSSGRLFADLVGASPPSDPSSTVGTNAGEEPASDLLLDRQFSLQSRYRSLHYVLRQVCDIIYAPDKIQRSWTVINRNYQSMRMGYSCYKLTSAGYTPTIPSSTRPRSTAPCQPYTTHPTTTSTTSPSSPTAGPPPWNPSTGTGRPSNPPSSTANAPPMPVAALTMFMVFNISAIIKVRSRVYEYSPERYYRLATRFSADCFSQILLASIQALMLQIVHCLHTPAEASVWTLIHVGMAHCVELGLHREPGPGNTDPAAVQQVKRLVFYTYYGLDRYGYIQLPEPIAVEHRAYLA